MGEKITFANLVEELSDDMIIPKSQSQDFINALTEVLLEDISKDGKAALTNFGSFKIVQVSERAGVNPQTGESITIPAHNRLAFTPYKALEKSVNRQFEHLAAEVLTSKKESDESTPVVEAIIPTKKEEKAGPEKEFDDPFKFDEDEENNEQDLQDIDNEINEDSTENEGTPGLPEKDKTNSLSPAIILIIIAVFISTLTAVWYFIFREDDTQPELVSTPPDTNPDYPAEDESMIPMMSSTEEAVLSMSGADDSQVIPMVDPSSDFVENPAETMSIDTVPEQPQNNVIITYSVSSGVWIYEIARQTYGNTRLWPLIFQANYTLDNNPDEILPNINLNIPRLEGTTDEPSASDYARLAQAARYVADAYEFSGNTEKATAYRKAAGWYETLK